MTFLNYYIFSTNSFSCFKIPHSFDQCDCIVFRLYVKLLSTHGPNLAYCAIFLNKLVNFIITHLLDSEEVAKDWNWQTNNRDY